MTGGFQSLFEPDHCSLGQTLLHKAVAQHVATTKKTRGAVFGEGKTDCCLKLTYGLFKEIHPFVGETHVVVSLKVFGGRLSFILRRSTEFFKNVCQSGIDSWLRGPGPI